MFLIQNFINSYFSNPFSTGEKLSAENINGKLNTNIVIDYDDMTAENLRDPTIRELRITN
jgi:hypothetical protein